LGALARASAFSAAAYADVRELMQRWSSSDGAWQRRAVDLLEATCDNVDPDGQNPTPYVGMSGRAMNADPLDTRRRGLWTRLNSHASGRRSGDQFCVYVCDRLVVPDLTTEELEALRDGELSLDARTKAYVRDNLAYRFVVVPDSATAFAIERLVQSGALVEAGKPILNPR